MSKSEIVAAEFIVPGTNKAKYVCELCSVSFVLRGNLNRHLRKFHQLQIEVQGTQICALCDEKFRTMAQLHEHIQNQHSITLQFVEKTFYSMKDFQDWKNKIEEETQASFICRTSSANKFNGSTFSFYNCHRSGHYKFKQNRVRNVKASGSIKTGSTCPAIMKVSTQTIDEISEIKVQHQSVHLGHELETHTLRFSKKDRENLAACLKLGIPIDKILDEVKQNCPPTNRYSLLTRKHLHNIRQSFGIGLDNKKTHKRKAPQSTNVEGSDSSIGYEEYHEAEENDHQEVQEHEKAVSSLHLLELQNEDSHELNSRKRQIINQLKELQRRIEEWNPECPLPEVEEYIKTLNARLNICACFKKDYNCVTKDSEHVLPKKPSTKRRKIAKKGSKISQSNSIPNQFVT